MRKVRNQRIHSSNPSLLFARGVESIVGEHIQRRRNEAQIPVSKPVVVKSEPRGNFLNLLMRQFANY
ncbi:MAG TPA: hypothetical protein VMZ32_06220 [Gammaproteobacteria bacterium]|nr:hypothetical protein [Gammaproteobacteria bacterium]